MSRQLGPPRDAGSPTTSMEMSWAHGGPGGIARQAGLILLYTPITASAPGYVLHGDDMVIGREADVDVCVPLRPVPPRSRRDGPAGRAYSPTRPPTSPHCLAERFEALAASAP